MLEIERKYLLQSVGLGLAKAPTSWGKDPHFPSPERQRETRRKESEQRRYAESIAQPLNRRDIVVPTGASPTYTEQLQLLQGSMPGPGEYNLLDEGRRLGGPFARSNPKTFVEVAATNPTGPGDYNTAITNRGLPFRSKPIVKFIGSERITETDAIQKKSRHLPGEFLFFYFFRN